MRSVPGVWQVCARRRAPRRRGFLSQCAVPRLMQLALFAPLAQVACERADPERDRAAAAVASLDIAATHAVSTPPASARAGGPSFAAPSTGSGTSAAPDPALVLFDPDVPDDWLPRASPADAGVDPSALGALIAEAERSDTDALVVVAGERVVAERTFGRAPGLIETRSLTKSVVGLALLALVADGAISSLDAPLSTFFPEFREGDRARVTLRHVLTHTSGLRHGDTAEALNAEADRLAYAKRLPLVSAPGARFAYNNEAAQLLAGIIAAVAGPADEYLRARLFAPLGIRDFTWVHDRAGNVQSYFGLAIGARDLARIGLMLRDDGRRADRQLLPAELVRAARSPSPKNPSFGLLWWLRVPVSFADEGLAALHAARFGASAPLAALGSRHFASEDLGYEALAALLAPAERERLTALRREGLHLFAPDAAGPSGFYGVGALGQRLEIMPEKKLVVVRQHRHRPADDRAPGVVTWARFHERVAALVP